MSNGHLSLAGSVGALFDPGLPRVRMVGQIAAFHIFELLFSTESAHFVRLVQSNGRLTHSSCKGVCGGQLCNLGLGELRQGMMGYKNV